MKIKKQKDVNTLPGTDVCAVLAGSFFKAFLNCAIPKTTFRIFIQRKYPPRLLEGQVLSKTAYFGNIKIK